MPWCHRLHAALISVLIIHILYFSIPCKHRKWCCNRPQSRWCSTCWLLLWISPVCRRCSCCSPCSIISVEAWSSALFDATGSPDFRVTRSFSGFDCQRFVNLMSMDEADHLHPISDAAIALERVEASWVYSCACVVFDSMLERDSMAEGNAQPPLSNPWDLRSSSWRSHWSYSSFSACSWSFLLLRCLSLPGAHPHQLLWVLWLVSFKDTWDRLQKLWQCLPRFCGQPLTSHRSTLGVCGRRPLVPNGISVLATQHPEQGSLVM